MSNCKHETAVVTCTIKNLGLTQMICTWRCRQPFWMLQTGLTTKEIPNEEAVKMITGVDTAKGNLEADAVIEAEGWWYIDGAWLCPVCQDGEKTWKL